jgi:hypothetical protein
MSLVDSKALDLASVEGLRRGAPAASLSIASTPLWLTGEAALRRSDAD